MSEILRNEVKGFAIAFNLPLTIKFEKARQICNTVYIYDNRLHKFLDDEICNINSNVLHFLDGYVTNIDELLDNELYTNHEWTQYYIKAFSEGLFPRECRGSFCGLTGNYDSGLKLFEDQVGSRALYYYHSNDILIVSSRYNYIVEILKEFNISYNINEKAIHYMLSMGYMIDETTYIKEIKRVLPGHIIHIKRGEEEKKERYYIICNNQDKTIREKDAIEEVDRLFKNAVNREFRKDCRYGYKHLVNLSGGLDSRMTSVVAHEMGYTEQLNSSYCKKGYLDFNIAQKIAMDLHHSFIFMPLDDLSWYLDWEELTDKNDGAAEYSGITGGNKLLKIIDTNQYGIEHTGMVGDSVLSTFFHDESYSYDPPLGNEKSVTKVKTKFNLVPDKEYKNREQYAMHTRGMLCAQSTYKIRQNYVECASPFMDVDFLNYVFSIPFEMRKNHNLYLKWIEKKHIFATRYGWEKWCGCKPLPKRRYLAKFIRFKYLAINKIKTVIFKTENYNSMNPFDSWLSKNPEIEKLQKDYFVSTCQIIKNYISEELMEDIKNYYNDGKAVEKCIAVTCVEMIRKQLNKSYGKEYKESK